MNKYKYNGMTMVPNIDNITMDADATMICGNKRMEIYKSDKAYILRGDEYCIVNNDLDVIEMIYPDHMIAVEFGLYCCLLFAYIIS